MRRLVATLLVAAACTSMPAQTGGSSPERATAAEPALYLTDSFNGAGLIAFHPLTLQDRSPKPLLPIAPTGASNSWTAASLDGSTIAVMNYNYGDRAVARGLDITVFDARTGTRRASFNPEVPVIVDGLSADGSRIYARNWPPSELTAERLVLDATSGKVLEREPGFAVAGDVVRGTIDDEARRLYRVIAPTARDAKAPRAVDLVAWDLRTGKDLWRLNIPSLAAGEWSTGRSVGGVEIRSRLVPALALSADRRQIAVVSAFALGPRGTIWLIDADTGTLISQRTYSQGASILEHLFGPGVAMAKSPDESVMVHASFSMDGQLLHVYAQSWTVDDQGAAQHQYFGMVTVALRDASVRGHDIKMELYWYENRIEWMRPSHDGKWLYVFVERTGNADPKGHFLRRLDASTLRVLAERRFDAYHQPFVLASR